MRYTAKHTEFLGEILPRGNGAFSYATGGCLSWHTLVKTTWQSGT